LARHITLYFQFSSKVGSFAALSKCRTFVQQVTFSGHLLPRTRMPLDDIGTRRTTTSRSCRKCSRLVSNPKIKFSIVDLSKTINVFDKSAIENFILGLGTSRGHFRQDLDVVVLHASRTRVVVEGAHEEMAREGALLPLRAQPEHGRRFSASGRQRAMNHGPHSSAACRSSALCRVLRGGHGRAQRAHEV
jgi:hypothetical protein